MYLYSSSCITIFLDGNFKSEVGCKDHAVLLFNIPFMYHVFISVTPIFLFNILQPCPVMVNTVRSPPSAYRTNAIIYARAAQTEVGGVAVRGPLGS